MTDYDLHVEVHIGEIVVTLPHTSFAVTYYKLAHDPQLYPRDFPLLGDARYTLGKAAEQLIYELGKRTEPQGPPTQ